MQRHDLDPSIAPAPPAPALALWLVAPPMPALAPTDFQTPALEALAAVGRLPGGVGVLNPSGLSAAALDVALADLADSRALILDLRDHPGGEADALLLGHLTWRPIPMATLCRSRDGVTLTRWTGRATAPDGGPHYPEAPVFVLIAPNSALAAQALAYDLRMAGRGAIVSGDNALILAWRRALSSAFRGG
ncbi:MAG: S41 family peptidase [Caulobacter sp.]|nr:S41 family peptidase [Caulobacter sp.]